MSDDEIVLSDPGARQASRPFLPVVGGPSPALLRGLAPIAKDLIRRTLTLDPARRITVDDALAHPWLSGLDTVARVDAVLAAARGRQQQAAVTSVAASSAAAPSPARPPPPVSPAAALRTVPAPAEDEHIAPAPKQARKLAVDDCV